MAEEAKFSVEKFNGQNYQLTHQFPTGSALWKFWIAKGSNASSQRDNLNLYTCFQIYLIRSRNIHRMLVYLGGFKPNMLPASPQKMSLGGCNQMFMTSRISSSDDKILSKKSSELGDVTVKMGQVTRSYYSIKGIF